MRVLISGGGIAGLTLAYWLHRYGIEAAKGGAQPLQDLSAGESIGAGYAEAHLETPVARDLERSAQTTVRR